MVIRTNGLNFSDSRSARLLVVERKLVHTSLSSKMFLGTETFFPPSIICQVPISVILWIISNFLSVASNTWNLKPVEKIYLSSVIEKLILCLRKLKKKLCYFVQFRNLIRYFLCRRKISTLNYLFLKIEKMCNFLQYSLPRIHTKSV